MQQTFLQRQKSAVSCTKTASLLVCFCWVFALISKQHNNYSDWQSISEIQIISVPVTKMDENLTGKTFLSLQSGTKLTSVRDFLAITARKLENSSIQEFICWLANLSQQMISVPVQNEIYLATKSTIIFTLAHTHAHNHCILLSFLCTLKLQMNRAVLERGRERAGIVECLEEGHPDTPL